MVKIKFKKSEHILGYYNCNVLRLKVYKFWISFKILIKGFILRSLCFKDSDSNLYCLCYIPKGQWKADILYAEQYFVQTLFYIHAVQGWRNLKNVYLSTDKWFKKPTCPYQCTTCPYFNKYKCKYFNIIIK